VSAAHFDSCRSLEFTGGIGWPCNCGRAVLDAEKERYEGLLSAEYRRYATSHERANRLHDALSEILHLEAGATLSDAQEIAYSALQVR